MVALIRRTLSSFSANYLVRFIFFIFIIQKWRTISGRVLTNCEFIDILTDHEIPREMFGDWTCLGVEGSGLNTSFFYQSPAIGNNSYGLFKIHNQFCCEEGEAPAPDDEYQCTTNCTDYLDENLDDDIMCARTVHQMFGFEAWKDWIHHCKRQDLTPYISDCVKSPEIVTPPQDSIFRRGRQNQHLSCDATGNPGLQLEWHYNMTAFPDVWWAVGVASPERPDQRTIQLIFPEIDFEHGDFVCIASNLFGSVSQSFHVKVIDEDESLQNIKIRYEVVVPIALVSITIIVTVSLFLYRKYLINVYGLTDEEIKEFEYGIPSKLTKFFCRNDLPMKREVFEYLPYDKGFEIKNGDLQIRRDEILGSGNFGIVYIGYWKGRKVAVKSTNEKGQANTMYLKALLTELKVMIHIGQHPNIVNLIGAQTRGLRRAQLHIAVEYCLYGDLEQYLRSHKDCFLDQRLPCGYISGGDLISEAEQKDPITYLDLLSWSCQIAGGMAHLELKKVLHGDLACRNVLLSSKCTAKVSDFGLSRQLYSQTNYVKCDDCPLPWRWMAIESLTSFSFGSKSDTWSFGVTLWEIFSIGEVPYPGLSWSQEFPTLLKKGMRLLKPEHASQQIYDVMLSCWKLNRDTRPDFPTLHDTLTQLKHDFQYPSWRMNLALGNEGTIC